MFTAVSAAVDNFRHADSLAVPPLARITMAAAGGGRAADAIASVHHWPLAIRDDAIARIARARPAAYVSNKLRLFLASEFSVNTVV